MNRKLIDDRGSTLGQISPRGRAINRAEAPGRRFDCRHSKGLVRHISIIFVVHRRLPLGARAPFKDSSGDNQFADLALESSRLPTLHRVRVTTPCRRAHPSLISGWRRSPYEPAHTGVHFCPRRLDGVPGCLDDLDDSGYEVVHTRIAHVSEIAAEASGALEGHPSLRGP